MKPKPNIFVVFGMPRTGTTFLHHTLQSHPDIFVPFRKEHYFFTGSYSKGLPWFESLFTGMNPDQIGADINPIYYLDFSSVPRLKEYDQNIKVILGVREPVDFAISLIGNIAAHGANVPPASEAVKGYEWELTPNYKLNLELTGNSMKLKIKELQRVFGDNLLLYNFEYFNQSPIAVVQAIENFLDVKPHFTLENIPAVKINASGRRNILFLNKLLTDQRFLNTLYAVTPRAAVQALRRCYEKLCAPNNEVSTKVNSDQSDLSADERRLLEEYFKEDCDFYNALFSEKPII